MLRRIDRAALLFAASSFAACAGGAIAMKMSGYASGIFLQNMGAWFVGLLLMLFLPLGRVSERVNMAFVAVSITIIALSFLGPQQLGVHRWISLGPIRANAAAIVLPATIALLATKRIAAPLLFAACASITALLFLQPDASQATAFVGASCVIISARHDRYKYAAMLSLLCLAAASWFAADPLAPVDIVEDIVELSWDISALLACAMIASLAITCLAPLSVEAPDQREAAIALATYFVLLCVTTAFGHYPVPLAGLGLSFPIGWWLGYALLRAATGKD